MVFKKKKNSKLFIYLLVIISLLIIGLIVALIFMMKKEKYITESSLSPENLLNVATALSKININSPSTYKFSASPNQSSFPSNFSSINSMDCLKPIYYKEQNKFLGLFMHNVNSTFQIFMVENTSDFVNGNWNYVQCMELDSKGMPYLFQTNEGFWTGGEFSSDRGNYVILKFFIDYNNLVKNTPTKTIGLDNSQVFDAFNIGTPDIRQDDGNKLSIGFHYTKNDFKDKDIPGSGSVVIPDNIGNYPSYKYWQGNFQPYVNNAIRTAIITIEEDKIKYIPNGNITVPGKIGARDYFDYKNRRYYIYEAQLSPNNDDSDEAWESWRIFLYCPDNDPYTAVQIPLQVPLDENNQCFAFANPRVVQIPNENNYSLGITCFIPGQVGGAYGKGGEFLYTIEFPST